MSERSRRIVLEHTNGRLKGIHSIVGLECDAPHPLPEFVEDVDMLDHHAPTCLVGVKRSYVLYREVTNPENSQQKHFDKDQR